MNASVWPTFAEIEPLLQDVIARWHQAESQVSVWESVPPAVPATQPEGWAGTTELLQLINTFQWHEEDRSRAHGAGDEVLGSVKRSIDASNRRRVQTVDRLDDLIYHQLKEAGVLADGASLNSESPGSIIDRLSVLALKVYHISEAIEGLEVGSEQDAMREKLEILTEQSSDLGQCLDVLMTGIREGKIGLKLYRQVKVYQSADTGKLNADLD
jgi:Protein of unknown function (DUF4254)